MAHWSKEIDFRKISPDNPYGFNGFKTIRDLCAEKCSPIPEGMGIYIILAPLEAKPEFNSSNAGFTANGCAPKDLTDLESNWVDGTRVLYIGKAGGMQYKTGLKRRLRAYFRWLNGKKNKHLGGRDIWQINEPEKLLVAWRLLDGEEPRTCEHALIDKFGEDFSGRLPFANRQR